MDKWTHNSEDITYFREEYANEKLVKPLTSRFFHVNYKQQAMPRQIWLTGNQGYQGQPVHV